MRTFCAFFIMVSAASLSIVNADDTEIFFSSTAAGVSAQGNIILILDNSGSMLRDGVSGVTSKLEDLKVAMHEILDNAQNVNIGIVNFLSTDDNHGSRLVYPVTSTSEPGALDAMKAVVDSMEGETYTPIVGALYESIMVFRGGEIEESSASYSSPMLSECQSNQIILLSDGQPYKNEAVSKTESLIGASCAPTGSEDDEIGRKCGYELAEWIYSTDHASSLPEHMNVSISTVGFNITSSFLEDVANIAGGNYYEADSSSELVEVFTDIISKVSDTDTSFEAPATSIDQFNRLSHSKDLFFAMFKPATTIGWSGNLKRYQIIYNGTGISIGDVDGNTAIDSATGLFLDSSTSFWSDVADGSSVETGGAAGEIVSSSRNVLTHLGDISPGGEAIADNFTTSNSSLSAYFPSVSDIGRESIIKWARGEDVNDEVVGSNERKHMGDILHSSPAIVNYSDESVIYVGTNDGFLHAIAKSTGREVFSFIPQELIPNLATIFSNSTSSGRPYGLDGDITLQHDDLNEDGIVNDGEKAYLYFGMRRGGRDYYALDVSNADAPRIQWQIKGGIGDFNQLGQTWSRPVPTKIFHNGSEKDVLIFGGGYDPTNHDLSDSDEAVSTRSTDSYGNTVFIVDAEDGGLIWSAFDDFGFFGGMRYSIPSDLRVIDINGDSLADRIYVGDLGGQVWRFDIAPYHNESSTELVDGGVLADLGTGSDLVRFFNEPDAALVSHGGERFMSVSIGSGWRAHPLDTAIEDNLFMIRDNSPLATPEGYGKLSGSVWFPINQDDLDNVTYTVSADGDGAIDSEGWKLSLTTDGEKNLSRAVTINNQVIFTTYAPIAITDDPCQPVSGQGYIYALDVATGDPALALSGSGSATGTIDDRKLALKTNSIPPAASALLVDTDGEIRGNILVGVENVLEDLPFSALTKRTYWQDKRRGSSTPSECRTSEAC